MLFVKDVLLLHECHHRLNILVFRDPLSPILSLMFFSQCVSSQPSRDPCTFILCLHGVKKICPLRTYMCWMGLYWHMTWGKWWLCLTGTYYTLTQHGYVRQILKQLKLITLGCEKVNVMNIHMFVRLCCNIHQPDFLAKNLGMIGHSSWLGARKEIARSVNRENLKTWH